MGARRRNMSLTDEDKAWIDGRLERVETALLTEFHKWASPLDMRVRSHSAALRAIDVELEAVADRVSKIEGKRERASALKTDSGRRGITADTRRSPDAISAPRRNTG